MNRIGVFLPNWIGDVVMSTPALRALHKQHPEAEIVGIHRPYISDVLDGTDLIHRSILHDRKSDLPERRGLGFTRLLKREQFDEIYLFTNSLRTGWVAWLSGAKRRVGFANEGRGWMLTDALPGFDREVVKSALDYYIEIVEFAGCEVESQQTELATTDEDEHRWQQFQNSLPAELQQKPIVTFNAGGAFGEAKHWSTPKFAELGQSIVDNFDRTVVVLCGPTERDMAQAIVQKADREHVVSMADQELTIGLSKAAVKHSELLVTTDSGPRHFAQPFDVPVITIFGPTHIGYSETYYKKGTHIQLPVDCGPCQQRTCPLVHHKCMQDLTVERVFQAVRDNLDRYRRQVA
ncbi:lipopolysaccharide heptosyltransferase II [Planctomycetaceae bacterium]|jgi:heptosyltransferase II|nr:lipopolysaccharide heptosyltransferase II [Planctomycetaceae bacterium]MDC0261616.1 lipopolysaccharide heptosyltransferase II [Planctomycetaceae bacterium]MDC0274407.1 lipopolysaccharide heptosyltransferase II [Planctomycetaceae bacterium]MDG2391519.1 lipopolysaccharide heptosyltransferase II [Planctomycetaceae bacterium]